MLYQDYKLKINKIVGILRTLRKFRIPIIIAVSAILVAIASFIGVKGAVFGTKLKNDKIEYGSQPVFSATAMFSDVRYEYCSVNSTEWTQTVPTQMGEYKARAVGKGLFGERYSDEMSFTIVPKKIEVKVFGDRVVYGENPSVTAPLVFSDSVYCSEFVFTDTTQESTSVTPVKNAIIIKDKNGNDVTASYSITVKSSNISFDKRDITLTVEDKSKEYDGDALQHEVWDVTGGKLVYGDTVVKVDGSFSFIIGAGTVENKAQFKVIRTTENGTVDVTHQYNINQIAGELKVEQRPIIIYPDGGEYVYDGQVHTETGFRVDESTPLVSGHTIEVRYLDDKGESILPFIIDVGEKDNLLSMIISSPNGDVTDNYCFTYAGDYKLKVTPRPISVTTESQTIVYDGFVHTFEGCETSVETPLADGHRLTVKESTSVKNVGKVQNILTVGVIDASGKDVSENYSFSEYTYGEIEVTKKDITVKSSDFEFLYNGEEQKKEVVSFENTELCQGHTYIAEFLNSIAECGDSVTNAFKFAIYDSEGNDVTENYNIEKKFGQLTVTPLPIFIITDSEEKVYDGLELKAEGFTYYEGSNRILDKHNVKYYGAPSIINAGVDSIVNEFTIKIFDENDVDKTFNYDITYMEYGKLFIKKRVINVYAIDYTKEYYDGQSIKDLLEYGFTGDGVYEPLAPNQNLTVETYVEDYVNAGERSYSITNVVITDTDGNDVTENYLVNKQDATVYIGKRPITVTSNGFFDKVYYDGEKHREETYEITSVLETPIVEGQYIEIEFLKSSYVEYATQDTLNMFNVKGIFIKGVDSDGDGKDDEVTENYTVISIYGTLHLEKRPVSFVSGSIPENTVVYDGYEHSEESFSVLVDEASMGLVDGHTAYAKYLSYIVDAGEKENEFNIYKIEDANGNNVWENYEITHEYGTLRVYPRPISLTSQGSSKVYDDIALENTDVIIGGMGTADGQYVELFDFATITNVGEIQNTFSYIIRFDNGEEVNPLNYSVTVDANAMLTVTKRPVTVTVGSAEKVYDGEFLYPTGYDVEQYFDYITKECGLIPTHIFDMELYGMICVVGSIDITHGEPVIVKYEFSDSLGEYETVDVTDNYEITVIDGTLTVTERDITVDVTDVEREYDGTEFMPGYEIGGLGLANGERIEVTLDGVIIDAGSSTVTVKEYAIFNAKGENVTFCYNVECTDGIMTVNPREIVITISGGYKEYYDGGTLVSEGYTVDRLLENLGHTISLEILGAQTDVGSSFATLKDGSVVIIDAFGTDVTRNYVYTYVDGELTVEKKRPITITSESATIIYDGLAHLFGDYTIGGMGLATERQEVEIITFINDSIKTVGTYTNEFTVQIILGNDRYATNPTDVTHNYEITYEFGTVIVEKRVVEIITGGCEKVFDGTPLTNPYASYICDGFPSHESIVITTNGTVTYVTEGEVENTYTVEIYDKASGESTIENYEIIDKEIGTLKILPLELTITSNSDEKIYDGLPLENGGCVSDWETTEAYNKGVLQLIVTVAGTQTEIGRSDNIFSVSLIDEKGIDLLADNCIVTIEYGTLTVYADTIKITSGSNEFTYDGREHKVFDKVVEGYINPLHELAITFTGSGKNVGTYDNTFTYDFVDSEGNSVKEFYPDVQCEWGAITVNPYKMEVDAPEVFEKYSGQILYAPQEIVLPNEYLDHLNKNFYGDKFTYAVGDMSDIFVTLPTEKKTYSLEGRFQIFLNGEAVPMTNFDITYYDGSIELSKKTAQINVDQLTQTYNGRPAKYYEDSWYIEDGELLDGHYLVLALKGELTEAGELDMTELMNTLIAEGRVHVYDSNNNDADVTSYYDFVFVGTPLTVLHRYIQITAGSLEKVYDGKPLTCEEYYITGGSLVRGHKIESIEISGSIVNEGYAVNTIVSVVIVDENGNDVTHNYNIDTIDGTLHVYVESE